MLKKETFADMHTHCEYSHDSVCKMEDMCLAQMERGTKFFAVTDHCDMDSYTDYDVFSKIKDSYETAIKLKKKYKHQIELLAGVEIGEGFWHPKQCEKILKLCEYDVVIGSVHLVQYKDLTYAYAKMDFSILGKETIVEYVDAYFDDMLTMIENVDFDILAHMTVPLRYINGKYNVGLDLTPYEQKIDSILDKIIGKGIALEVNTSSYEELGDFMPSKNILKRYYDKGGSLITLGSDAHKSNQASIHFEQAMEVIKQIGFQHIYYYKKRKPYAVEVH